jgi:hypothetical protein
MKTKTQIHFAVTRSAFAITLVGMSLLTSAALAQDKGGTALMGLNRQQTAGVSQPVARTTTSQTCPMCKDVTMVIPDTSAKGGEVLTDGARPSITVSERQCPMCSDKFAVVGLGKGAHAVFQRTCSASGAQIKSCCASAGSVKSH